MRWENLRNGLLIQSAADGGFDVFLSIDKNIEREQDLLKLPLAVVILDSFSNSLLYLIPFAPVVLSLCSASLAPALYWVQQNGSILKLTAPR